MKKFLIRLLIFTLPLAGFAVAVFSFAGGYTDPFYLRFTSPRQTSLILGTSRAAQGLNPAVINPILKRTDIYNFGFTLIHSPYGPVYLQSIKRKLNPKSREGIFILSVDPWSISSQGDDPNDPNQFVEKTLALGEVSLVNMDPNIPYLLKEYPYPFYKLFHQANDRFLHANGWLEVSIPMHPDSARSRRKTRIAEHKILQVPYYKFSEARLKGLEETIDFLSKHGKVYLVRLPVHHDMFQLDNSIVPDFNEKMKMLSDLQGIPYLDMTADSARYRYTDGNHTSRESVGDLSKVVAEWISEN